MQTKTKNPTPIRIELIKHSGCRVLIEGRISHANYEKKTTCIVDITINGEKIRTDHLRFKMKHNLAKGDRIAFKGKIGLYDFKNYGITVAKRL